MIDHIPLRRTVLKIIAQHPARNPATFDSVTRHFLPKYIPQVKANIIHLARLGWVENASNGAYLASGDKPSQTNPARLYKAISQSTEVGGQIGHKEVMRLAQKIGLGRSKGESALQSLVNSNLLSRIGRGQLRLEAEIPDVPTLNELGPLLPPHNLVWEALDDFLPTKFEDLIEVLASDSITPTMIEDAINDLSQRGCINEMTSSDGSEGYLRAEIYKPTVEELVYYTFRGGEEDFSPKEAKGLCSLTETEVHQALYKLRDLKLLVREGRGVYRTVPQGVRQETAPVVEPVVSEPVVSEPVALEPVVPPAPRVSSISLGDFERVARQYRSSLQEAENFYRSIEPQEREVNQLREQAQRLIDQADSIDSVIIERKRKVESDLKEAKEALAPFTR